MNNFWEGNTHQIFAKTMTVDPYQNLYAFSLPYLLSNTAILISKEGSGEENIWKVLALELIHCYDDK